MVSRIWDLLFYEGRVSLFCVALGILKEIEKPMMKFDRMDRLYEFLKNLNRVKLNIDKIIKVFFFFFESVLCLAAHKNLPSPPECQHPSNVRLGQAAQL